MLVYFYLNTDIYLVDIYVKINYAYAAKPLLASGSLVIIRCLFKKFNYSA